MIWEKLGAAEKRLLLGVMFEGLFFVGSGQLCGLKRKGSLGS
jgi:hypothetical protein